MELNCSICYNNNYALKIYNIVYRTFIAEILIQNKNYCFLYGGAEYYVSAIIKVGLSQLIYSSKIITIVFFVVWWFRVLCHNIVSAIILYSKIIGLSQLGF